MSSEGAYPWFFFYRIARLSLLVFLPALFLILFLYRSSYKEGLVTQMSLQIEEDLKTLKSTFETASLNWQDWCSQLPPTEFVRYTFVNPQGNILCDSIKKKANLKVKDASEILNSFKNNFSLQVRYSDHFGTYAVFGSLRLSDQLALRKVVPISTLKDNMNRFDRVLFLRIVPFAFLSYCLFLFLFYRATKPLGNVLSKLEKFKVGIPFNKTLRLLYQKDEWAQIEEALNEADLKLTNQVNQVRNENEKIAAILESIYDDIIAVDPFETILFYNSNFKRHFMPTKGQKEITPKIWHVFSDEQVLNAFKAVLKDGQTQSLKGIHFLSGTGPQQYFDLTITSLRSSEGKINGALGVFYDVTEFKLTEQMRVDFVANISHEIRTPLTSIKGYTQILQAQDNKIDPSLHLFLQKILTNTERMIALFSDLLNLSVIESKNLLKFEDFALAPVIDAVTENILTNYAQKNINIEKDLKLTNIKGDPRLFEQVISNLIDNACKYSGPDILIKISCFQKDQRVRIVVADNGPGIPEEHLQRIFERFYRIDSSREASRGTGLGLSIVKHIIAKHGGKIWAEGRQGRGTAFIIELPLT